VSEQKTYRVIRGAIRLPRGTNTGFIMSRRDMIVQGELIPPGIATNADIQSWLDEGRIEEADVSVAQVEEQIQLHQSNPFRADPSALVGKTMEDLIIMILEIDEKYDTDQLADEKAAVQLLTSGWTPEMRQIVAPVSDKSRPEALALHKLEQEQNGGSALKASNREMSVEGRAGLDALEAAKALAAAPESQE